MKERILSLISEVSVIPKFQRCSVQLALDYKKVLNKEKDLDKAIEIVNKIDSISSFNLTLSYSNREINWNLDDEQLKEEMAKYRFTISYVFCGNEEKRIHCIPSFSSNYIVANEIIDLDLETGVIQKIIKIVDVYEKASGEIYEAINSN